MSDLWTLIIVLVFVLLGIYCASRGSTIAPAGIVILIVGIVLILVGLYVALQLVGLA